MTVRILIAGFVFSVATWTVVAADRPTFVTATNAADMPANTGGVICSAPTGPKIILVNRQGAVALSAIQNVVRQINLLTHVPLVLRAEEAGIGMDVRKIRQDVARNKNEVSAIILVAALKTEPALLVAPEERWAVINVDALAAGKSGASATNVEERLQKEIWRATAFVLGATGSAMRRCVLGPADGLNGLDELAGVPAPDGLIRIPQNARKMGIELLKTGTYRSAVQQGWAPDPTNDIQRAIWNEIKNNPAGK